MNILNPILLDLPMPIKTPRLYIRPPRIGDGEKINEAVLESYDQLKKWMPWAQDKPSIHESELFARTALGEFILRKELVLYIFDNNKNEFIGGTGFHRINWDLPSFEIGYWVRNSYGNQGIATESTNALVRYAFEQLHAVRIAISCDEDNLFSRKIPEKLGFVFEGIHKNASYKVNNKTLRNTVYYARYNTNNLPSLEVNW